ncbi:MAG: hypothetical protein BWZ08_00824 [candidate division BRC1 bacterium ADurb.BinA292]|nr:MAG: hypothetical protein BWZ08_00824 [candidate division BRC1 bacterium ADurb.BinA292]
MVVGALAGNVRGTYMRYDTAVILKRLFLVERMLVVSQAGWLPGIADFNMKTALPKMLWEDALTADALRERVFELRFPNRMLEIGDDAPLVNLLRFAQAAPSAPAFLMALAKVFKPALRKAFNSYLELADDLGDGPTYRFMRLATEELRGQIEQIEASLARVFETDPEEGRRSADWVRRLQQLLAEIGGIGLDPPRAGSDLPAVERPFTPAETPARDAQFHNLRFYWPDIIDPTFPYGEGLRLQLRSAVSHFNEVWAVENAGFILHTYADDLGWEFIRDAARWVYDESRHVRMGYERLKTWGFEDRELPLGTYIYDSCRGQDPLYRIGMLFYFESKNIGKKMERKKSFELLEDRMSQHDMDFDWADESIHTSYGKTWLSALLKLRGENPEDYTAIKTECERLVAAVLETAEERERVEVRRVAEHMIERAQQLARR